MKPRGQSQAGASASRRQLISNADLAQFLEPSDEWIRTRQGIHEAAHFAWGLDELARVAARRALGAEASTLPNLELVVFGNTAFRPGAKSRRQGCKLRGRRAERPR